MFSVIKKLTVALAAGLCLTVAGAFAHGDHGAPAAKVSGCCKAKPAAECAGSSSSKACPAQTAALPECCAKSAAGQKQECCAKHAAGQRQACCEKTAAVTTAAAPAGCCKAKADAAANGNLSSNMQNLMLKVDELRKRRQ